MSDDPQDPAPKEGAAALDAPPTAEEKRGALALREALEPQEGRPAPRGAESRWLAAHLRVPSAEDSLGDVRAWRLARAARESVQARRGLSAQHSARWAKVFRVGRAFTSTAGLLAATALLLVVSWLVVGQGQGQGQGDLGNSRRALFAEGARGGLQSLRVGASSGRATQALIFRDSLNNSRESPAQRLDLMIQTRLAELRSVPPADSERGQSGRGLAMGGMP